MTFEDLRCQDFVELATDYLEGKLTVQQRLVVELHLSFCTPCIDYLDEMRATIRATGALREQDVPDEIVQPLVDAFRELRGSSAGQREL